MFSLKNLLISLFAPAALMFGLSVFDRIFNTELFSFVMLLTYLEHLYVGYLLDVDLEKGFTGGWIPLPGNPAFYVITAIFDYLLVASVIYVLLAALTKCHSRSQAALIGREGRKLGQLPGFPEK